MSVSSKSIGLSVIATACAALPMARAQTPGPRDILIKVGWGLSFDTGGHGTDQNVVIALPADAWGTIGYSSFDPTWGTLDTTNSGGTVLNRWPRFSNVKTAEKTRF